MWKCLSCEKMFQLPYTEKACPFCGSVNIGKDSDFLFPKMDGLIPQVGKDSFKSAMDSFGIDENDYEEAGLEMPDESCAGCEFINECTDGKFLDEESGLPEWILEISFNDLDINELVLLEEAVLEENEGVVRSMMYITDMTERFLHTFIDADFVPA